MQVNMYSTPAEAQFINTYAPVDFNDLYRIATTQAQMVQDTLDKLALNLLKFGEFRSPSTVDTQNYYNLTIGSKPVQDILNDITNNPDLLKDAAMRARINSAINNIDYLSLSMLRESAENQRKGLEMRAKMEAEGIYNPNWDQSDISNYDTLGNKAVFSDITPTRYMTANELSDQYFNNLQPSDLGQVVRNGVRYNKVGIDYNTLYNIADAKFNDLVSTPQGLMYYKDFVNRYGNTDLARQAFVTMIADSQRDRIVNRDTVDPLFMAQYQNSLAMKLAEAKAKQKSGSGESLSGIVLRSDMWKNTQIDATKKAVARNLGDYTDYLTKLSKDKNTNVGKNASIKLKQLQELLPQYALAMLQFNQSLQRYQQNPNDQNNLMMLAESQDMLNKLDTAFAASQLLAVMLQKFLDQSKINPTKQQYWKDSNYSTKSFNRGVNAALDEVSFKIADYDMDKVVGLNDGKFEVQDENGEKRNMYTFASSNDFVLPEKLFSMYTGLEERPQERNNSIFSLTSDDINMLTLLSSGAFSGVKFSPTGDVTVYTDEQTSTPFVKGKLRISKDQLDDVLSTGFGSWFGSERLDNALERLFNAKTVNELVGDDKKEYIEFDVWKIGNPGGSAAEKESDAGFPKTIGSTTLVKESYPESLNR